MPADDLRKLLDACDQVLEFYRDRGKESTPPARRVRETRQSLERRLTSTTTLGSRGDEPQELDE